MYAKIETDGINVTAELKVPNLEVKVTLPTEQVIDFISSYVISCGTVAQTILKHQLTPEDMEALYKILTKLGSFNSANIDPMEFVGLYQSSANDNDLEEILEFLRNSRFP